MTFILNTEYLRQLNFHHLVWQWLERTNSFFQSSSFRSIEGSGREKGIGDRHREMQKKVPFAATGKSMNARCNESYQGRCQGIC